MLRALGNISCTLDPKVKVKGTKAGICDGVHRLQSSSKIYLSTKTYVVGI